MNLIDLYKISDYINNNFKDDIENIEVHISVSKSDCEEIDKELYDATGQSKPFTHTKTIDAKIDGLMFFIEEKK